MKMILWQSLVAVILVSCVKPDNSVVAFDLSKRDFQEISLRSNDFVKNWRVVKLETTENSLITPYDKIYPADNYIIIFNYNKILQFDYSGKFIRELAKRGEGPNDINGIISCEIDSKREYLFLNASNPNSIRVYDLKNKSFKEPVPLASDNWLTSMYLINDSEFLCFPQMGTNRQLYYIQDFYGNFINGKEKPEIKNEGPYVEVRLKVMTFNDEWFYQGNYEDTVYNVLSKEPVAVFSKGKNAKPNDVISTMGKEDLVFINSLFCTSKDYMLSKICYDIRPSAVEGAYEMHTNELRYYVFNWNNKTTCEIKSIYIEPFDKYFEKEDMEDIFKKTSSLNHKKIVISISDDDSDDNPTLYIGDLF